MLEDLEVLLELRKSYMGMHNPLPLTRPKHNLCAVDTVQVFQIPCAFYSNKISL